MKRIAILAAMAAVALSTSACITVIDASGEDVNWTGENAQPFDTARNQCHRTAGHNELSDAFRDCMAEKGWTRG